MIRFSRWFAKTLWTLLAVLLVVLAIVVQVGRELSPQLTSYRPDLERYLSAQLELPVTVADLDVSWQGLTPRLHLRDLVVHAPDRTALQAAVFTVELDLAASLLHRQLYWRQGLLADVDLVLDQHADGRWALHGQTLQPRTDTDFDVSGLLRMLSYAGAISLDNINIHFRFLTGRQSDFALTSVQLDNDGDFQRLTASLTLPEQPEVLTLVAERHGSLLSRPSRVDGYLRIRQLPLQKSALISEQLADSALMQGTLDLALWLQGGRGQPLQVHGDLNIDWAAAPGVPRRLRSDLRGEMQNGDQWQLGLINLQTDWASGSSPALQGVVSGRFSSEQLVLQVARLELAPWQQLLQAEGAISGRLADILGKVQPAGALTRLHLQVPLQAPAQTLLRANLEQVAVNSWVGAPALRQVDGYLQADVRGGRVDLDSRHGFSMHYPTAYTDPMTFDMARGQVAWQLRPDANAVLVNSGKLQLRRGDSRASGYFYLRTPWLRHSEPGELYLQLGLANAPATDYAMYVPFLVDEGTRNWLTSSIRGGRIASAGFIYRGYFDYGRDHGRAVQLQADIREGQLQFHPDWPGLTDVAATLSLSDGQTRVDASAGKLLGTALQQTRVELGRNPAGGGHLLNITGSVAGPAEHGLDMLRQTPLRQWVGSSFDRWHLLGDLQASVDLAVPLRSGAAGARQRVQVSLPDATLRMEDLGLQVDNLQGQLRYDSATGLSATALQGQLWGQPLQATMTPPAAGGDTFLDVKGAAAVTDIATWLRRPELMFASGLLPYQLRVTIPRQSSGRGVSVAVTSDLQGVGVRLPEPYGKAPEARRNLAVAVDLSAALRRYRIDYEQVLRALFEQAPQQPLRGAVTLNHPLPAQVAPGIRVSGALPEADLQAWVPLLGEYQHFSELLAASVTTTDAATTATAPAFSVDLAVGGLQAGGQRWQDVQIQARQQASGWTIGVENPQLRAAIDVFADGSVPVAALDYLYLPAPPEASPPPAPAAGEAPAEPDPAWRHLLDGVTPAQFFPIDVRVDALKVGDKDFGRWSFHLRTAPDEVRLESLRGEARGLRVEGGTDAGSGALLRWRDDGQSSQSLFSGSIGGRDFGKVLQRWGLADAFEAERAHFPMALYWPGSPVAIRLATLTGNVDVSLRKGRFHASGGSGSSALLRLMGLFNFDSWSRRLKLDFSDTFRNGTAFDEIDGSLSFQEGIVYLQKPMEVVAPSARLLMAGTIDLVREEMDTSLVATLPVGGNLTMAAVFAGGLPAAAGVYVISKLFKNQVDKVASVSYRMQGSWDDPVLSFDKLFDSKAASRAGAKATEQLQEEDAAPAASPSATTAPAPGSESIEAIAP